MKKLRVFVLVAALLAAGASAWSQSSGDPFSNPVRDLRSDVNMIEFDLSGIAVINANAKVKYAFRFEPSVEEAIDFVSDRLPSDFKESPLKMRKFRLLCKTAKHWAGCLTYLFEGIDLKNEDEVNDELGTYVMCGKYFLSGLEELGLNF